MFVMITLLFSREKETEILKDQIDKLNNAISREEEKAKDLEVKARSRLIWTFCLEQKTQRQLCRQEMRSFVKNIGTCHRRTVTESAMCAVSFCSV